MRWQGVLLGLAFLCSALSRGALREEHFDREPPNWEGINNRSTAFEPKRVVQDFGFSAATSHAGGEKGEAGGRINPAGEAAYYGYRLPKPLNLSDAFVAQGKIMVPKGSGHFLLGFFNTNTLNEWRTPNTLVARINNRGEHFHCHLEYCSSRWRAEAGVIGEIVRGERLAPRELACDKSYEWKLIYEPNGEGGRGIATLTLNGQQARCEIVPEHRADGATFTHFGLLPVLKTWDGPGEAWIDDVRVNGKSFDFAQDPKWDGYRNHESYVTKDTRPRFDFGWSPTAYGGGIKVGELGGLIFRGDCREPARMASYGDRLEILNLKMRLHARGKVAVLRAISDSTASIGFYNRQTSMATNGSQQHSIPMDYLGINIEGPSSEGFFFYPVYRVHGDSNKALGYNRGKAPRIYPDSKVHNWTLDYDPDGVNGKGTIKVTLDEQSCELQLAEDDKKTGAEFNRFGICTPWIDGNSVTVYFDDLVYTASPH